MDVGRCRPLHQWHHVPSSSLKSEGRRESQWLPLTVTSTTPTRAMLMMGMAGKMWPKRARQPSATPWCTSAHATGMHTMQNFQRTALCAVDLVRRRCMVAMGRDAASRAALLETLMPEGKASNSASSHHSAAELRILQCKRTRVPCSVILLHSIFSGTVA
jgi:hypothetical protein